MKKKEELLFSHIGEIIESLPTDEEASREANINYSNNKYKLSKQYKYFSPTYRKVIPEQSILKIDAN